MTCPVCGSITRTTSYGEWCDECGGVRRSDSSFYVREVCTVGESQVLWDSSLAEYSSHIIPWMVTGGLDQVVSAAMNASGQKSEVRAANSASPDESAKIRKGLEINFTGPPDRPNTHKFKARQKALEEL